MKVAILSDTHNHLDEAILKHCKSADAILHAGDFGTVAVFDQLNNLGLPFYGVYGNIDGQDVRQVAPLEQSIELNGVKIWMQHITGYPGKYTKAVKERISSVQPDVVVCGHSHILKVMPGEKPKHLHINPGACGKKGFHQVRTMIMLTLENEKPTNLNVIELGKRV
jgi:putative phosphoesterase